MRFNTWLLKSLTGRKKIPRDAHFARAQHRQRTCRSRTDEQKWHPAEAGSIVWQKQVQERNPDVFNPYRRGLGANTIQSTETDWQQLLRVEPNHQEAMPPKFESCLHNVSRRMEWSTVSNTALRSKRAVRKTDLSSAFTHIQWEVLDQYRNLCTTSLHVVWLAHSPTTVFKHVVLKLSQDYFHRTFFLYIDRYRYTDIYF